METSRWSDLGGGGGGAGLDGSVSSRSNASSCARWTRSAFAPELAVSAFIVFCIAIQGRTMEASTAIAAAAAGAAAR